jgi:hypothetical protein
MPREGTVSRPVSYIPRDGLREAPGRVQSWSAVGGDLNEGVDVNGLRNILSAVEVRILSQIRQVHEGHGFVVVEDLFELAVLTFHSLELLCDLSFEQHRVLLEGQGRDRKLFVSSQKNLC